MTPVDESKPSKINGKIISGRVLKNRGISLNSILSDEYSSVAIELQEVK